MEGTLSVRDVGDGSCSDPAARTAALAACRWWGHLGESKAVCGELIACCSTPEEFA